MRKGDLAQTFLMETITKCAAGLGVALVIAGPFIMREPPEPPPPDLPGRTLTQKETALVKKFFGAALDPERISLYHGALPFMTNAVAMGKSTIIFNSRRANQRGDYTTAGSPKLHCIFLHEATHSWQNQTKRRHTASRGCVSSQEPLIAYHYDIHTPYRFQYYCGEQQGALVEDYCLRFLQKEPQQSNWASYFYGADTPYTDAAIKAIVEDQFPGAKKLRQQIQGGPQP